MGQHKVGRTEFAGNPPKAYRGRRGFRVLCQRCKKGGGTLVRNEKDYQHKTQEECDASKK